jgi:hypothetical protein
VNSFFELEKLPYELGWRPPIVQTNFPTLALMVPQIVAAADDELLEGAVITASMSCLQYKCQV